MDYSHSVRPHWCPFFLQHLVEMLYRAKDCCSPSNVFLGSSSNGDRRTEEHSHQFLEKGNNVVHFFTLLGILGILLLENDDVVHFYCICLKIKLQRTQEQFFMV